MVTTKAIVATLDRRGRVWWLQVMMIGTASYNERGFKRENKSRHPGIQMPASVWEWSELRDAVSRRPSVRPAFGEVRRSPLAYQNSGADFRSGRSWYRYNPWH